MIEIKHKEVERGDLMVEDAELCQCCDDLVILPDGVLYQHELTRQTYVFCDHECYTEWRVGAYKVD